ncbi:MAG: hypothetical protein IT285_01630 [Bdellovibrionales bacterium]|nr:hypothetical protein [Bdellovibrionales bacterium]
MRGLRARAAWSAATASGSAATASGSTATASGSTATASGSTATASGSAAITRGPAALAVTASAAAVTSAARVISALPRARRVQGLEVLGNEGFLALLYGARGRRFSFGELVHHHATEILDSAEVDDVQCVQQVFKLVALELQALGQYWLKLFAGDFHPRRPRLLSLLRARAPTAASSTAAPTT